MTKKQIIAIGGGGFSTNQDESPLDEYVLRQSGKENPKICFLPTASGDSDDYIQRFYRYYEKQSCQPTHLSLLKPTIADIEAFLLKQDILFVGGGNTRNLLAIWAAWGVDQVMKKAWEQGILLAGISAGAICWFEQGLTDSIPGKLTSIHALGFLQGSTCPHYDSEVSRRSVYQQLIREGTLSAGYAIEDQVALHFIGTTLHKVVSASPTAQAYRIISNENQGTEQILTPEILKNPKSF